jgi:glyoxylase-like metal-dependent hydrolase (beta-lactamase superfamily II)
MKIHAIKTGSVAVKDSQRNGSRGQGYIRLFNTLRDSKWTEPLPIYAWVIEHPEGTIVIDTGETAETSEPAYFPRWHPYYRFGVRMFVEPKDEIGPQMMNIGLDPEDVRWVVLTHMHTDHAGGLKHFPNAEILVAGMELNNATGLGGRMGGYLENRWPKWFNPVSIEYDDQPFGNFPKSRVLTKDGDIHIVPTPGHSVGHQSVILQNNGRTYFFAGDVSYTEHNLKKQVVDGVSLDVRLAKRTISMVMEFVSDTQAVYLPSHDPESGKRLANDHEKLV